MAEDAIASWLEECCIVGGPLQSGCSALFGSWKCWAEQAGEHAGSQKRFSQAMQSRGFASERASSGRAELRGVGLKVPSKAPSKEAGQEPDPYENSPP